jgi:hypothetical protein
MPVPNTFANATTSIPLSQLDANFATPITLGNTAIQLGNTVTTLNNMSFANVTITSVSTPITAAQGGTGLTSLTAENVLIGNGANAVKVVAPGTAGNVLVSTGTTWASQAPGAVSGNVTIGNTTIALGGTATSVGNLTLTNVTISSGSMTGNIANSSVSNTSVGNAVSDSVNVVGYMGLPQNSQNGNYNVVLGDAGKHIYHPAGQAAATYTFPANSNVAFTVGTAVTIINGSANNVTIAITTDTMTLANSANTSSRVLTANGVATCVKIASTSWIISGAGLS